MVWVLLAALRPLQSPTAFEVKSNLRLEISDLNNLLIHMHIAYTLWTLLAASENTTASKQPQRSNLTSDLKSVIPNTYILINAHIAYMAFGPFGILRGHCSLCSGLKMASEVTNGLGNELFGPTHPQIHTIQTTKIQFGVGTFPPCYHAPTMPRGLVL